MDKLKIKHDHKLTDILKVGLFGIFLLLPLLVWLPSALYFGFNEHANNLTKTVAKKEIVDFNQNAKEMNSTNYYAYDNNAWQVTFNNNGAVVVYINATSGYGEEIISDYSLNFKTNDKYLAKVNIISNANNYNICLRSKDAGAFVEVIGSNIGENSVIFQPVSNGTYQIGLGIYTNVDLNYTYSLDKFQLFNLTQMFGKGNEPTIQEFNTMFPNEYYDYNTSNYIEVPTSETITILAATDNMEIAWQDVWKLPVFEWTGRNNFNFTINLFTNIFGITEYSYLTNYLTYLLVMTAIYVIFDIVLSMFKLVTHLINSKE